ncbi:MAG: sialidase family protein [Phycisphaerales bacterium]|nr:sialidase family protein [Phycisphaerales bacterium]
MKKYIFALSFFCLLLGCKKSIDGNANNDAPPFGPLPPPGGTLNGVIVGRTISGSSYPYQYSYTTDGGKTWSNAQTAFSGIEEVDNIVFSTATNGVAVGSNYISPFNQVAKYSFTTNGGKSWTDPQNVANCSTCRLSDPLLAFSSANNGVMFMGGGGMNIFHTQQTEDKIGLVLK